MSTINKAGRGHRGTLAVIAGLGLAGLASPTPQGPDLSLSGANLTTRNCSNSTSTLAIIVENYRSAGKEGVPRFKEHLESLVDSLNRSMETGSDNPAIVISAIDCILEASMATRDRGAYMTGFEAALRYSAHSEIGQVIRARTNEFLTRDMALSWNRSVAESNIDNSVRVKALLNVASLLIGEGVTGLESPEELRRANAQIGEARQILGTLMGGEIDSHYQGRVKDLLKRIDDPLVGRLVSSIRSTTSEGEPVDFLELTARGRFLVVFGGFWCGFCQKMEPDLEVVNEQLGNARQAVRIVQVMSHEGDFESFRAQASKNPKPWIRLFDGSSAYEGGPISDWAGITARPHMLYIENGRVVASILGARSGEQIIEMLSSPKSTN